MRILIKSSKYILSHCPTDSGYGSISQSEDMGAVHKTSEILLKFTHSKMI